MGTSQIFCTSEVIYYLIKEFEHWRKSKKVNLYRCYFDGSRDELA